MTDDTAPRRCGWGFFAPGKGRPRRLVDWRETFVAALNGTASDEGYLSVACFPDDFATHFNGGGTEAGYTGAHAVPLLFFDIDRPDDLDSAIADTCRLVQHLTGACGVNAGDVLVNFSGLKGFHVRTPTSGFVTTRAPSRDFAAGCKAVAMRIAAEAGVVIDAGVYNVVRLLRLPNSLHDASGLHAVPVDINVLANLSAAAVRALAASPVSTIWTPSKNTVPALARLWEASPGPAVVTTTSPAARVMAPVSEGQRNAAAFNLARYLRDHGHTREAAEEITLLWNATNLPPSPIPEIQRTVASAYTRAREGGGATRR